MFTSLRFPSPRSTWRSNGEHATRRWATFLVGAVIVLILGNACVAVAAPLGNKILAKAPSDECFVDVGSPLNSYDPAFYPNGVKCTAPAVPKVNQAYVWGLTKSGSKLWFGTVANTLCLVVGGILGFSDPIETPSYVCEFNQNQQFHSDSRPPQILSYEPKHKKLTAFTMLQIPQLQSTLGLRSAGSLGNMVFLAGPSWGFSVNMFAFDSPSGAFLGFKSFPMYSDIRTWAVYKGVLYAGVQNKADSTGRVLRWIGTPANPFVGGPNNNGFEEVGTLDAEAANLAVHMGRLYATTWTGFLALNPSPTLAGLFMSPAIDPVNGLTTNDPWTKVWSIDQYESDPNVASTLAGGAIASYCGKLYWGMMQIPFSGAEVLAEKYPANFTDAASLATAFLGTTRPIPIFRCCGNPSAAPNVELLYGSVLLPVYDSVLNRFNFQPNNMHVPPLYGPAGFGNPFNTYTWSMAVYKNKLFVGTFDWTYLLLDGLVLIPQFFDGSGLLNIPTLFGLENILEGTMAPAAVGAGADLWRFDSPKKPALPESRTGVGNHLNYGVRNMVADDALYVGSANAMNLKTDPGTRRNPKPMGGWELRVLY